MNTRFTQDAGIEIPIICGAMYPCSNPELVAAVSQAGGMGIIQPISLTYVHGYEFRAGIQFIQSLTDKPIGMNVLIESASKKYRHRMQQWIDIALEENIRFFITSLGKPDWVTQQVHAAGGKVYHDVTEHKWAIKGIEAGVDGLIAVNHRAGGHAGTQSPEPLYQALTEFNVPIICAGGISTALDFAAVLKMGYSGIQMGTRFITTLECNAMPTYKQAIIDATAQDIVLSERITGVPVSIIKTSIKTGHTDPTQYQAGRLSRWLLSHQKTKHWMRTLYTLRSLWQLKRTAFNPNPHQAYWQAGKSVQDIHDIVSVETIIENFAKGLKTTTTTL